jgi:hypothetical protein
METTHTSVEAGSTVTADDSKAAHDKLMEMAKKQHALAPTLSVQQWFERLFADPTNAKLAAAAHL